MTIPELNHDVAPATRDEYASRRRLPIGAECMDGGVHFRVSAPRRRTVRVVLEDGPGAPAEVELAREDGGHFSGFVAGAGAGTRYRYQLDGGNAVPDPASRYQPDGPHGASAVVDPTTFRWTDTGWPGPRHGFQVFYELHVGTFTREGTFAAASEHLSYLADLGVTVVELMPVAEFPGRFGWGYDGVQLFAPYHRYGTPDDLRRFVDRAHSLGLAVILDVVYNHFGPDGNYLGEYTDHLEKEERTEWGAVLNYDGPGAEFNRELVFANVRHWIVEYHLDGLRLDATQDIHDESPEHLIAAIVRHARDAAGTRTVIVTAENEPQRANIVRSPDDGGFGADMLWNDDFHHSALVALTGRAEAYQSDYEGSARELGAAVRWGFLYQGQWYDWQQQPRGTPALDVEPWRFVTYLENHDQVANLARGRRLHQLTSHSRLRALTALFLLGPGSPLLFQGQEFASSRPFVYFADHTPDLARSVRQGRLEFLTQFPRVATDARAEIADPAERATFEQCLLEHEERVRNGEILALHRDLLAIRHSDPTLCASLRPESVPLADDLLVLRWLNGGLGDRLLVVNLGRTRRIATPSDPLLAPPARARWRVTWASEHPAYGGDGVPPLEGTPGGPWTVPAECAYLLVPEIDASSDS